MPKREGRGEAMSWKLGSETNFCLGERKRRVILFSWICSRPSLFVSLSFCLMSSSDSCLVIFQSPTRLLFYLPALLYHPRYAIAYSAFLQHALLFSHCYRAFLLAADATIVRVSKNCPRLQSSTSTPQKHGRCGAPRVPGQDHKHLGPSQRESHSKRLRDSNS